MSEERFFPGFSGVAGFSDQPILPSERHYGSTSFEDPRKIGIGQVRIPSIFAKCSGNNGIQKIGVLRLAPGPYVRLRDAKRRLNNPQAVSITRSTNPSLRLRNVSWTMRKTLMPPILCSTCTRIREMSRLDSFSSGVNSLPRGSFLG